MRFITWQVACAMMFVTAVVAQNNVAEQTNETLYNTDESVLFPAIKAFAIAPETKADIKWVRLDNPKGTGYIFAEIPDGWFTWESEEWKGRTIAVDQSGFRMIIRLTTVPDVGKAMVDQVQYHHHEIVLSDQLFTAGGRRVSRMVTCQKLKADTHITEYRFFETEKGAICVELTVFDGVKEKRTLQQLVTHVRLYYGKYEGVCRLMEDTLYSKK